MSHLAWEGALEDGESWNVRKLLPMAIGVALKVWRLGDPSSGTRAGCNTSNGTVIGQASHSLYV